MDPTRSWISINYIEFNYFRRNIQENDDPIARKCLGDPEYIYVSRNPTENIWIFVLLLSYVIYLLFWKYNPIFYVIYFVFVLIFMAIIA